jgi:hypothetical protein
MCISRRLANRGLVQLAASSVEEASITCRLFTNFLAPARKEHRYMASCFHPADAGIEKIYLNSQSQI